MFVKKGKLFGIHSYFSPIFYKKNGTEISRNCQKGFPGNHLTFFLTCWQTFFCCLILQKKEERGPLIQIAFYQIAFYQIAFHEIKPHLLLFKFHLLEKRWKLGFFLRKIVTLSLEFFFACTLNCVFLCMFFLKLF